MKCIYGWILFAMVFDFLSDWAQFIEVTVAQEYKKAGEGVHWALLAFCLVGTVTFIAEVIVLRKKRKSLWIVDFITIWFEDIPQIVLTAIIAYYHSEVGSLIQVIKASATILEAIFKFATGCCKTCGDFEEKSSYNEYNCCHKAMKYLTVIGYILTVFGAVLVLGFAMITIDQGGSWHFHKPTIST